MKKSQLIVCLMVCFCVLVTVDILFKSILLEIGIEFTLGVQSYSMSFLDTVCVLMDRYQYWFNLLLLLYVAYEVHPREGLELIIVFQFTKNLVNFLKVVYADPRPFWVDEEVVSLICKDTFGNPSGHTSGATVALLLFMYRAIPKCRWKYALCLACVLIVHFVVVYTGVHYIFQAFYGAFLSLCIFMIYKSLKGKISETFADIKGLLVIHFFCIATVFILWVLTYTRQPVLASDYIQNFKEKCNETEIDGLDVHFVRSSSVFLIAGCALGMYLNRLGRWWGGCSVARMLMAAVVIAIVNCIELFVELETIEAAVFGGIIRYSLGLAFFFILPWVSGKLGFNNSQETLLTPIY